MRAAHWFASVGLILGVCGTALGQLDYTSQTRSVTSGTNSASTLPGDFSDINDFVTLNVNHNLGFGNSVIPVSILDPNYLGAIGTTSSFFVSRPGNVIHNIAFDIAPGDPIGYAFVGNTGTLNNGSATIEFSAIDPFNGGPPPPDVTGFIALGQFTAGSHSVNASASIPNIPPPAGGVNLAGFLVDLQAAPISQIPPAVIDGIFLETGFDPFAAPETPLIIPISGDIETSSVQIIEDPFDPANFVLQLHDDMGTPLTVFFDVQVDNDFTLDFDADFLTDGKIEVTVNDTLIGTLVATEGEILVFSEDVDLDAIGAEIGDEVTVGITLSNVGDPTVHLDNLSLTIVPEPSTWALGAAALLIVAAFLVRRRRRQLSTC